MLRISIAGFGLALSVQALAFEAFDPAGFTGFSSLAGTSTSWVNEEGSTMTIWVDAADAVTGQYINHAAGTGCQNAPYPIAGRVNGTFISFSVAWKNGSENCFSVTGWSGYAQQANDGTLQIVTDWNLAYQGRSGPAIEAGSDLFSYVAPREGGVPMKK